MVEMGFPELLIASQLPIQSIGRFHARSGVLSSFEVPDSIVGSIVCECAICVNQTKVTGSIQSLRNCPHKFHHGGIQHVQCAEQECFLQQLCLGRAEFHFNIVYLIEDDIGMGAVSFHTRESQYLDRSVRFDF
jgi:hypothetical protein